MRTRLTIVVGSLLLIACAAEPQAPSSPETVAPAEPVGASPPAPSPPGEASPPSPPPTLVTPPEATEVDCQKLELTGDPRGAVGARWVYRATHPEGTTYDIQGILFTPAGAGPFPAVVVSHGKGGSPSGYSARVAKEMVGWGLVAIGTQYSHAPGDAGLPKGSEGASAENIRRARATRALLGCLGYVDGARVAAHGHSMGAFVTAELVGTTPTAYRVASHTAGGTNDGGAAATRPATAAAIRTPYQMHHGDADLVVLLRYDRNLAEILAEQGVEHALIEYPGFGHEDMSLDPTMFASVRAWYASHGMF